MMDDSNSLNNLVSALYESISFGPGEKPDWNRFRELFINEALLLPPSGVSRGKSKAMNIDEYISFASSMIERNTELREKGFAEIEINRIVEKFGSIAHIFSIYHSFFATEGENQIHRGVNSIQAVEISSGWRISSFLWEIEDEKEKIPEKYLP
ncbi:MAG: hypothetical protein JW737_00005 [Acidobacteria bacterium]|nr:hypothetical protein [Acidobacteriota bacterium]